MLSQRMVAGSYRSVQTNSGLPPGRIFSYEIVSFILLNGYSSLIIPGNGFTAALSRDPAPVCRRLPTAAARLRVRAWSCEICGGHRGSGVGLSNSGLGSISPHVSLLIFGFLEVASCCVRYFDLFRGTVNRNKVYLFPFLLFTSLHVSASTGHPQVKYTQSFLKAITPTTDPFSGYKVK
jgi:hypothetical protein